jgi:hypothetical protein
MALEDIHDAPPPGAGAVLEMTFHAGIRRADDLLDDVVDALVPLVALSDRELGALLDIDDKRDRDARIVGPANRRRSPAIAEEIPRPRCRRGHDVVLAGWFFIQCCAMSSRRAIQTPSNREM